MMSVEAVSTPALSTKPAQPQSSQQQQSQQQQFLAHSPSLGKKQSNLANISNNNSCNHVNNSNNVVNRRSAPVITENKHVSPSTNTNKSNNHQLIAEEIKAV
jgi:hypothetical protein